MYVCQVCDRVSQPGYARLTHVVHRNVPRKRFVTPVSGARTLVLENGETSYVLYEVPARTEVEREVAVCGECKSSLNGGVTLFELAALRGCTVPRLRGVLGKVERRRSLYRDEVEGDGDKENALVCDVCGSDARGGDTSSGVTLCAKHAAASRKVKKRKGRYDHAESVGDLNY